MISEIAKIKQYKAERKAWEASSIANEVAAVCERKEQLIESLETFTRWQAEEVERLFEALAMQPATIIQLDEFNAKINQLKLKRNDMLSTLSEVRDEEASLQLSLEHAFDELRAAQRLQEKFHSVAAEIESEQRLQNVQHEERLSESDGAEGRRRTALSEPAFNLLIGA